MMEPAVHDILGVALAVRGVPSEMRRQAAEAIAACDGKPVDAPGGPVLAFFPSLRRALSCALRVAGPEAVLAANVACGVAAGTLSRRSAPEVEPLLDVALGLALLAPAGAVLAGKEVEALVRPADGFAFRPAGTAGSGVFRVEHADVAGPARAAVPFVGRASEVRAIGGTLRSSEENGARVVAVVGEAGIGKSRLLDEAARIAGRSGLQVLLARTGEDGPAAPYALWLPLLRTMAADPAGAEFLSAQHEARRSLGALLPELAQRRAPGERQATPERERLDLLLAVADLLRSFGRVRPAVLILDDLHWADAASLEALTFVAANQRNVPVSFLVAYRPDGAAVGALAAAIAELARTGSIQVIAMQGLDRQGVADFLGAAYGESPSLQLVDAFLARTDGNPFYLGELVRLNRGAASIRPGEADIPETVRSVVRRRLGALPDDDGVVLAAAVLGRSFAFDVLESVTGADASRLTNVLDRALALQIVDEVEPPGEFRFHHALVREAVLDGLSAVRRLQLEHEAAGALTAANRSRQRYPDIEIAGHLERCAAIHPGCRNAAVDSFRRAGAAAEGRFAWRDAADAYRRAVELLETHDLSGRQLGRTLVDLGRAAGLAADWRLAWKSLMRGSNFAREAGDAELAGQAALHAADVPADERRLVPVLESAIQGLAGAHPRLERRLVVALYYVALRYWMGDVDALIGGRAAERRAQFAAVLEDESDPETRLLAELTAAWDAERNARFSEALDRFEAVFRDAERLGDPRIASEALLRIGYNLIYKGELSEGEAALRRVRAYAAEHQQLQEVDLAQTILAAIAMLQGDYPAAGALAAEIPPVSFWTTLYPAALAELSGDHDRALALLPSAGFQGATAMRALVLAGRTRILFTCGRPDEARAEVDSWLGLFGDEGWASRPENLAELDDAAQLLDDRRAAALLESLNAGEGVRATPHGRGCDHLRGDLAFRLGRFREAERHYTTGLRWATDHGVPVEAARCQTGLARLAERRNDFGTARVMLARAADVLRPLGRTRLLSEVARDLERLERPGEGDQHAARLSSLSRRERQVLVLLASGRTNRVISAELVISEATVARHVSSILAKLHVANRTEAARVAAAHGLPPKPD